MNTEITDKEKFNGWVLYDGDCRLCTGAARHFQSALARRHFKVLPLQTPWIRQAFALTDADLLREMRLLKPDGKSMGGVDALLEIARLAVPTQPILAGWVGMTGVVFILHFGLFHILSLVWRQAGVSASPVMQNPLLAKSLADFWGARWNTAFNELAFRFTYRPLRRWMAPGLTTLCVFVMSGLIHESVISLPAHGGYGLPTLYFLAQGFGIIAERSRYGQFIGLGRGARGWIFMLFILIGPVFWLFHLPFIINVILPMLKTIGAT